MGAKTMNPFKWTNDICNTGRTWRLSIRDTGQIIGRVITAPLDDGSMAFTARVWTTYWKPLGSYLTWQEAKKAIQRTISGHPESHTTSGS